MGMPHLSFNSSRYSIDDIVKILIVIFLSSFSVWLISYYTLVIKKEIFYTHFIYIPAILSSFWWGKKGSINAFFLGFFLLMSDFYADVGKERFISHLSQLFIFFIVSILTGIISDERKEAEKKEREALKEREKFLEEAAHYFLNPIAIAKGYIEVLSCECASDKASHALNKIKEAIGRIEEVVKNTVEKGIIYESGGDISLKQKEKK